MNRSLRSARRKQLLAVIAEYEHALHEVVMCDQPNTCEDCKRVAQGALDRENRESFGELVEMWKGNPWAKRNR